MRFALRAESALRSVRLATLGLWGVSGLVVVALGGHGLWLAGEKGRTAGEASRLEAEMQAAEATLEEASRVEVPENLRGLAAVSAFQRELETLCKASGAQLTEFSSGSELLPFVTRFALGAQQSDWSETEVSFTARGNEQQVVNVLLNLSNQPVPVEMTSLDMERIATDRLGSATVEARGRVRVLSKSG
ncbi:MAG: hypothetical protein AB1725_02205 [Armatimonadota bacterium]